MAAPTVGSLLFEPLEFAGLRLPNRLVMAPVGTCQDADGYVTDALVAYYRRRAEGGAGAITVEASLVTPESLGHEPRIHGREFVPGLRRIVDAVRPHGPVTGIQLLHPGRQVVAGPSVAPSAVPLNSRAPIPRELARSEIRAIAGQYAQAAVLAAEAGFDFVEVHGAHGYLPSDFLSPLVNERTDAYGGNVENRTRFSVEVAAAILDACELPLFWRISGEEAIEGGYGIEDALELARRLEDAGVVCLSVSGGTWHTLHVTVPPMFVERGQLVAHAAQVKRAVGVPVIAAGRLDDPTLAERVLADGAADLITLGRGLIADPDWPRKVASGRADDIRPCIACNACVDLVGRGEELRCAVNPEVGREATWRIEPARRQRRVMVVGSGPAGMEAATIARLRGHHVSIWEQNGELGGKLDAASRAPSKSEVLRFRDYQVRKLIELDVDVHVGVEVTGEVIERERPDVVVAATGAEPLVPPIPGIHGPDVVDAQELLFGRVEVSPGERVAVIGGSATGCETAEFLVASGVDVTIVEMLPSIGHGIEAITRRHLVRELRRSGVEILTDSKVTMIERGRLIYETPDGRTGSVAADTFALALGFRPRRDGLPIDFDGRPVIRLGDASQPADFVAAVNAGADAGLAI